MDKSLLCQPETVSRDAISSACKPLASTSWRIRGVVLKASGTVIVPSCDALLLSPYPNGGLPISKSGAFGLAENQNQIRFKLFHDLAL